MIMAYLNGIKDDPSFFPDKKKLGTYIYVPISSFVILYSLNKPPSNLEIKVSLVRSGCENNRFSIVV